MPSLIALLACDHETQQAPVAETIVADRDSLGGIGDLQSIGWIGNAIEDVEGHVWMLDANSLQIRMLVERETGFATRAQTDAGHWIDLALDESGQAWGLSASKSTLAMLELSRDSLRALREVPVAVGTQSACVMNGLVYIWNPGHSRVPTPIVPADGPNREVRRHSMPQTLSSTQAGSLADVQMNRATLVCLPGHDRVAVVHTNTKTIMAYDAAGMLSWTTDLPGFRSRTWDVDTSSGVTRVLVDIETGHTSSAVNANVLASALVVTTETIDVHGSFVGLDHYIIDPISGEVLQRRQEPFTRLAEKGNRILAFSNRPTSAVFWADAKSDSRHR